MHETKINNKSVKEAVSIDVSCCVSIIFRPLLRVAKAFLES